MTFEDDYIVLVIAGGPRRQQTCLKLGLQWPPPEWIYITNPKDESVTGFYRRERFSGITDEQRKGMTHVCRGAEYFPDNPLKHKDVIDVKTTSIN